MQNQCRNPAPTPKQQKHSRWLNKTVDCGTKRPQCFSPLVDMKQIWKPNGMHALVDVIKHFKFTRFDFTVLVFDLRFYILKTLVQYT